MRKQDPLQDWLRVLVRPSLAERSKMQTQLTQELIILKRWLDTAATRRHGQMNEVIEPGFGTYYGFDRADFAQAQALYRRVVEMGGKGNQYVQEQLLIALAASEDPGLIPFWRDMIDFQPRPRDQFLARRRTLALASLALMAIQQNASDATLALRSLTHHAEPVVRADAIYYLAAVQRRAEGHLPVDIAGQMVDIAMHDSAFAPRFQARAVLRQHGLPVPFDFPGGVYELRVQLASAQRTLLARSENTLEELHLAIQDAFGWDADHLYCFFMNGQDVFDDYRIASPAEDEGPYWAQQIRLGELGLVLDHRFIYYFDYGDGNQFQVEVTNICLRAKRGTYPKLIESLGEAPVQYRELEEIA